MAKPPPNPAAARKPRADAQRNRERILEVAKEAFGRAGGEVSMDDVGKRAGVGAGTLYRHFPTRGALLETVYRTEVEKLAAAQREYTKAMPPVEALRVWLCLFVDYIATKQIIVGALNALMTDTGKLYEASGAQITGAINALVQRAVESGDVQSDLDPVDFLRALVGVFNVAGAPDWPRRAKKLVDILIAGSRLPKGPSPSGKQEKKERRKL